MITLFTNEGSGGVTAIEVIGLEDSVKGLGASALI